MATALRLLRILIATIICIVLFAGLFGFFNKAFRGALDDLTDASTAVLWALAFGAPGFLYFGTIPLTALAFGMDRLGVNRLHFHVTLWAAAGLIVTIRSGLGPSAAIAGALSGGLYWLLAGRAAGKPGVSLTRLAPTPRRVLQLIGYAGVGYFAYLVLGLIYLGGKMLWVTAFEPSPGNPPFATEYERDMTTYVKVAMMDFPDPESCLESGAEDGKQVDLKRLDWDEIDTPAEATVCIFRLLGSYGDISRSDDWLEAQGFRVSDKGSFENLYVGRDGSLRVAGYWSIRENGPKFPTRGPIRRAFFSIPYRMIVNATWSSDGQTLRYVDVSFDTL